MIDFFIGLVVGGIFGALYVLTIVAEKIQRLKYAYMSRIIQLAAEVDELKIREQEQKDLQKEPK